MKGEISKEVKKAPRKALSRRGDSSPPVCSVSCTVHLQLFTYIDKL